jgi:hypothetical protein
MSLGSLVKTASNKENFTELQHYVDFRREFLAFISVPGAIQVSNYCTPSKRRKLRIVSRVISTMHFTFRGIKKENHWKIVEYPVIIWYPIVVRYCVL